MKRVSFLQLFAIRMIGLCLALVSTFVGAAFDGRPVSIIAIALLFVALALPICGLPCFRKLDQRFLDKHGLDIKRWLHYGVLAMWKGVVRWLLVAMCIGRALSAIDEGWPILLRIPALLLTGIAFYGGYPGLESYGVVLNHKAMRDRHSSIINP